MDVNKISLLYLHYAVSRVTIINSSILSCCMKEMIVMLRMYAHVLECVNVHVCSRQQDEQNYVHPPPVLKLSYSAADNLLHKTLWSEVRLIQHTHETSVEASQNFFKSALYIYKPINLRGRYSTNSVCMFACVLSAQKGVQLFNVYITRCVLCVCSVCQGSFNQ